jgi:type I restriction enzyme, S subunit
MKAQGKELKDDKWKDRYKEPTSCSLDSLPVIPDSWMWSSTEELSEVATGATPKRGESKYYENGSFAWVTSGALNDLFIDKADEYITEIALKETNAKIFPVHTLLIAMYGEGQTRGRVSELLIESATNQACAALIFKGIALEIQPIIKLFFQKYYEEIRRFASGGVQPNLNLSMVKSIAIPIPPIEEQLELLRIVNMCMSTLQKLDRENIEATDSLDFLDRSILAKAFRGELVPQDPNDEPAAVLLERIRTEREQTSTPKQRGKTTRKNSSKQLSIDGIE